MVGIPTDGTPETWPDLSVGSFNGHFGLGPRLYKGCMGFLFFNEDCYLWDFMTDNSWGV